DQIFALLVVRIRVGVSGDFGDRGKRPFRGRVVAQHAVALTQLLEGANGGGFAFGAGVHLLTLYEKRIPVVVVRVGAEDPVVSLRGRKCHRGFESALYTGRRKKRNEM